MLNETVPVLPDWYVKLPIPLIAAAAKKHGVDKHLIAAIIQHESLGNTWAMRFEPVVYAAAQKSGKNLQEPRAYASTLHISAETEIVLQCSSLGLMQMMGWVARGDHGWKDNLTRLFDPAISIELGVLHLKNLFMRYDEEVEVISAYNWGHASRSNGMFRNQKNYVDPVMRLLRELRRI